jgi:hypothetical protein
MLRCWRVHRRGARGAAIAAHIEEIDIVALAGEVLRHEPPDRSISKPVSEG